MSRGSVPESGDELEVDLLTVGFSAFDGVAELVGQRSAVVFAGGEVGAGFADRFVSAVQDSGPGAVPVAEQSGGFRAQSAHVRAFDGVGRFRFRLGVEGLDLFGDAKYSVATGRSEIRAYVMGMDIEAWPRRAAIASRLMPLLIAWVAIVWRS